MCISSFFPFSLEAVDSHRTAYVEIGNRLNRQN